MRPDPRSVTILGSTGSIGERALSLMEYHRQKFTIQALTSYNNVAKLAEQAKATNCKRAVIGNEQLYEDLKSALSGTGIEVAAGAQAVIEAAQMQSDIVIAAIVGAAGLLPTLAAIERGSMIALANKECLVCAGEIIMRRATERGSTIIPVDSEHSAIFQTLDFDYPETVDKIILTASGGPFREYSREQMENAKVEEALKHPVWSMGAKISIDSATLMNKGLELIEAWHLFPVERSQIEVIIHPESIVHSMVSYIDGSVLAQLGTPDMSTPISYALAWPTRMKSQSQKLDLAALGKLTFMRPDIGRFPALRLCRHALDAGGSAPAALNAANEVAVARFLNKDIKFTDIVRIIETVMEQMPVASLQSIEDVIDIDLQARKLAEKV